MSDFDRLLLFSNKLKFAFSWSVGVFLFYACGDVAIAELCAFAFINSLLLIVS